MYATLGVIEFKEENQTMLKHISFDEEGNISIPEGMDNVRELSLLSLMVEEYKDNMVFMLWRCGYSQPASYMWSKFSQVVELKGAQLTIGPYIWENFVKAYSDYTGIIILPTDDYETICEKIDGLRWQFNVERNGFIVGKNTFLLDDGRYLYNEFGKYAPNLTFILSKKRLAEGIFKRRPTLGEEMNINFSGEVSIVEGSFFVSNKGKKCFDTTTNPRHVLIRCHWGGAFNCTHGFGYTDDNFDIQKALYYRRASSNGGGVGNDFLILPIGYKNIISLDDI